MHRPRLAPLPDRRTVNEISILDRSGDLVERHVEIPNGDPTLTSSGFVKCFPWNDAILVAGYGSNGALGYTWIITLDAAGAKVSEVLLQGVSSTEIVDHSGADHKLCHRWQRDHFYARLRSE